MAVSTDVEKPVRLLCLGNDILADDAFGIYVAREAERRFGQSIEVVTSSGAGFNLLDSLLDASRLLVVDTIFTGKVKPGTIHVFEEEAFRQAPGGSPHVTGLFEVLGVARELGMPVPGRLTIVAVEAADCSTVGGAMHPDVQAAAADVMIRVGKFVEKEDPQCAIQARSG